MSTEKDFAVGDIIRLPAYGGGFRVWSVEAVLIGGMNQEGVIELRSLDKEITHANRRLMVPRQILEAADCEKIE